MRKGNGSNGQSARMNRDIQVMKRATVSLIEGQRQSRQEMVESRREMAEFRRDMVEMRQENQKMFAEMVRRNDRLEEEAATHRRTMDERTASLKEEAAALRRTMDERTASLKKVSDIHTKAIMRILDKI